MLRRYGWKPDRRDARDRFLSIAKPVALPASADLRGALMPPVYDQGELGSCTANAIAAAVDFERRKQGLPFLFPSRLFIYYNERACEGTVAEDSGAEIRDGIKSVISEGVCPETEWPYDATQFARKPPDKCYQDALPHKTLQYSRVSQAEYYIKHSLAILGRPVVLGINVFQELESSEVAETGDLPSPVPGEQPIGGHAIQLAGYDDATRRFVWRNSWGADWGQGGYGTIGYDYILSPALTSDLWVILTEA